MSIITDKQVDRNKWEAYLANNEFNTPFQSPVFFDLINSIEGFKAKIFAVENDSKIIALCIVTVQKEKGWKGYFSKRGIIYGGPLADNSEALKILLKAVAVEMKNLIYIETRNLNDYSGFKDVFQSKGWKYEPYLNYHLDCSSEEIAWANFNNNRKRQIKKAIKNGVTIEIAKNEIEVKDYYIILEDLYLKKIKKPLFSLEFFLKFFHSNVGKILLVKYQEKIIGGIVCPILEKEIIYELYICGLDQEYKDNSPSVMATFAAIEYGYRNGFKKFDFMGAGKPNEDYGVRDFKDKFGGKLVEHGRFVKINNETLYSIGKAALKILKKAKAS